MDNKNNHHTRIIRYSTISVDEIISSKIPGTFKEIIIETVEEYGTNESIVRIPSYMPPQFIPERKIFALLDLKKDNSFKLLRDAYGKFDINNTIEKCNATRDDFVQNVKDVVQGKSTSFNTEYPPYDMQIKNSEYVTAKIAHSGSHFDSLFIGNDEYAQSPLVIEFELNSDNCICDLGQVPFDTLRVHTEYWLDKWNDIEDADINFSISGTESDRGRDTSDDYSVISFESIAGSYDGLSQYPDPANPTSDITFNSNRTWTVSNYWVSTDPITARLYIPGVLHEAGHSVGLGDTKNYDNPTRVVRMVNNPTPNSIYLYDEDKAGAVYQVPNPGSTITFDQIWAGTSEVTLRDNVIIPSGKSIEIHENTTIKIPNGKKIEVSGTLTVGSGVTFTKVSGGTLWSGIEIKSGGVLDIDGPITIENATTGITFYNSSGSGIVNGTNRTTIKDCTRGIYVSACSPTIDWITIEEATSRGIVIDGASASPTIRRVTVDGGEYTVTDYGIYASVYSDASLSDSELETNIEDYRIYISPYGDIDIGGGNNNIDVNSGSTGIYIHTEATGHLNITENWWGIADPDSGWGNITSFWSRIDQFTPYDDDSNAAAGKIIAPLVTNEKNILRKGYDDEISGDIQGALDVYNKVISDYDEPALKRRAVKSIYRVLQQNNMDYSELRTTIEKELPKAEGFYKAILDYLLCDILLKECRPQEAVAAFSGKATDYNGTMMGVEMLIAISNIYCNYLDDTIRAKEYADRASAINPGHPSLNVIYGQLDIEYNPAEYENVFWDDSELAKPAPKQEETDTPLEDFVEASPNPFNPIATITYSIAEPSYVKLAVYNISGQKVATLVDGSINAGKHNAVFDGSNLASGMYFYRFTSVGMQKTGKMMLVK